MPEFSPAGSRIVLVALVSARGDDDLLQLEALRCQLEQAGARVVGQLVQRRGVSRERKPGGAGRMRHGTPLHPATFLGKGKVIELVALVRSTQADGVVFLNALSGTQVRNLEQTLGVAVLSQLQLPQAAQQEPLIKQPPTDSRALSD